MGERKEFINSGVVGEGVCGTYCSVISELNLRISLIMFQLL